MTGRWYNHYDRAIKWVDGRLVRLQIAMDISGQKQMELERREYETRIQQMQKMESIGRLAGGVAHDLNNLLSPILGYGELLQDGFPRDDPRRKSTRAIVSAAYRARDLVRQLLAFSRKQALEFKIVDMNQVLVGFEKLLRRTLREDIELDLALPSGLPAIRADVGQIEQVIMNLASNAQDAMPNGGRLTIESGVVDLDENYAKDHEDVHPGPFVMLAVSDTGNGMDLGTRERIFEPFYTTKGKGQGTGLGLATVYGIVKQHGGNIWVYSEPEHGATFKCYFPVDETSEAVVEESPAKVPQETRGEETVLVAEDNDEVRELAVNILKSQGFTVLAAADGKACLRLAEEHKGPIHLLLTDVVMPDMNGKELFQKISAQVPDIRVIYASGYTDDVIAHHGVLDEGINFLQKPFSVKGLALKVREVLDGP
jgi:signal transduction histidine kinase